MWTQTHLVTGASGFLGQHLTERLLAAGHRVRSLSRRRSPQLDRMGVEQYEGSVTDAAAVARAADGVDGIYHLAGAGPGPTADPDALYDLHIRGTRTVLQACLDLSIDQVLVVSAAATVGASAAPDPLADEGSPIAWDHIRGWPFAESKALAERDVADFVRQGLPVKVARPGRLFGPGDHLGRSTSEVIRFLTGRVSAALPGGLALVDVRDVAATLPTLMTQGEPGVGYLLSAANLPLRSLWVGLEQVSGVRAPELTWPRAWAGRAGRVLDHLAALRPPGWTWGGLDVQAFEQGCRFGYLDSSRAERTLGFTPRPISETLRETVDFVRGTGMVPP